ncbi:MAG: molybdopterin-guanine dinucleotide biosynthesis protein B [Clostridiales bacterium]|nr:molybdopterin-guanine dinucleotide biosynthesis protein B [Clostridiales bacterium]
MKKALVILCGGLSTRMGTSKTFLPFGSTSLLKYQIARFRPFFETIYLSVPSQEDDRFPYEDYCGCKAIPDTYARIGPMGGLFSCLGSVPEDMLFFTPVDAPFTNPALAAEICAQLEADETKYACAIQNPEGRVQPLFTAYTRRCLPVIEDLIQKKSYRLKFILTPADTLILDRFLPPEQFFNMNDPQSYYYALQKLSAKRPGEFPPDFGKQMKTDSHHVPILSFTAKSGTGKTTYLEKLIPLLKQNHLRIAVVKHDAHGFQIDKPGKDSYRLTQAGADHMILTSEDRTAAILSHRSENPSLESILARIENIDFIITEGYKLGGQKKIHLLRRGHNETPVGNPENTIAYVTDFPFEADVPVFDLNHPEDILPFLLDYIRDCSDSSALSLH